MHASRILQRTMAVVLEPMHAARRRVVLQAVQALIVGRRLTLTDLARAWPGATWMHAPLKALDRLLSNVHLHQVVPDFYQAMSVWLLRSRPPVIVVDWADLKEDGRWCVLRAGTPVGGRTMTLYEKVYPLKKQNHPATQAEFLKSLSELIPPSVRPIIISDAGFRSDWFRAVAAQGWHYVGRIRNNVKVQAAGQQTWLSCSELFACAGQSAEDLGSYQMVCGAPWACRLVRQRQCCKHRHARTRKGKPQQGTLHRKARKRANEPWLLATSLNRAQFNANKVCALYAERMQIEESFRDLKSHRYGVGLEESLTRLAPRLSVLLLLNALARFAAWLLAMSLKNHPQADDPLTAQYKHRARYSFIRRAMEWLRRKWIPPVDLSRLAGENL
jgi:hypothetical protein